MPMLIDLGVTRRKFGDDLYDLFSVCFILHCQKTLSSWGSFPNANKEGDKKCVCLCPLNYSKIGREVITASQWTEPGSSSVVWLDSNDNKLSLFFLPAFSRGSCQPARLSRLASSHSVLSKWFIPKQWFVFLSELVPDLGTTQLVVGSRKSQKAVLGFDALPGCFCITFIRVLFV